jgi:hypothetical protein
MRVWAVVHFSAVWNEEGPELSSLCLSPRMLPQSQKGVGGRLQSLPFLTRDSRLSPGTGTQNEAATESGWVQGRGPEGTECSPVSGAYTLRSLCVPPDSVSSIHRMVLDWTFNQCSWEEKHTLAGGCDPGSLPPVTIPTSLGWNKD